MTIEKEFYDRIDCKFPYQDKSACLKLIDEAAFLPPNALFFVIHEICRVPTSEKDKVNSALLLDLLSYTTNRINHPLKEMVEQTARKMILGKELGVDEVISKMILIKNYHGQYSALNILYFSCDDIHGKLEPVMNEIHTHWHKAGS